VAYLLKARIVEPQKQQLLGNGREKDNGTASITTQQILNKQEYTAAAWEQLGKHVPAATDTHKRMNGVAYAGRAVEL
jgi:hypothetical protein